MSVLHVFCQENKPYIERIQNDWDFYRSVKKNRAVVFVVLKWAVRKGNLALLNPKNGSNFSNLPIIT